MVGCFSGGFSDGIWCFDFWWVDCGVWFGWLRGVFNFSGKVVLIGGDGFDDYLLNGLGSLFGLIGVGVKLREFSFWWMFGWFVCWFWFVLKKLFLGFLVGLVCLLVEVSGGWSRGVVFVKLISWLIGYVVRGCW